MTFAQLNAAIEDQEFESTPTETTIIEPVEFEAEQLPNSIRREYLRTLAAFDERERIRKLNLPTAKLNKERRDRNNVTREFNRKLREENPDKTLGQLRPIMKPIIGMIDTPYKMAKKFVPLIKREKASRAKLTRKSPAKWAEQIKTLPDEVRNRIACIIWWDHFGGRMYGERWAHLDEYLDAPLGERVPKVELIKALHSIGFSEYYATRRVDYLAKIIENSNCDK